MQEWAAADCSVFMPEQTSGNITEQFTGQPGERSGTQKPATYRTLQTFPPACGSVFPIAFAGIAIQAFACIGFTFTSASGKIWCTLRQLGQDDLSGPDPSTFRLS
jgi:hypothetical protein